MAGEILDPLLRREKRQARDRSEILRERFERLPEKDKSLFRTGSFFLAFNSSLCGLIADNYLRRALNVTQARLASTLPMVFLPFASTLVVYEFCISQPLMRGDLNCATCASVRGGLIGAFMGCVYPALTAIPLCGSLAARYSTAPLPSKENMFRYWMAVCKPAYKKLRFAALLQAALGTYLGTKNYDIYIKMLQLPEAGRDPEELIE
ncbi:PREDICTED: transmembrane protein 126A [Gekko japonicus]|uniref:Transmembrane protein 126A n=1 Tax=Gekko japonicus TaxID=146911 RepID=A0ABM1LB75_GEKJA|nr:PREDICTED: transmembrane protein 126A [Gekko japonicus]